MDLKSDKLLDAIGQKIVSTLRADARISYSRLGRVVGLSTPAVTERVRKLEEAGIILGYHARIRRKPPGSKVTAFIELDAPSVHYDRVKTTAGRCDKVLECHHISGNAAFIIKVRADSVADLEGLVARFSPFGQTRTSIVLSSSKEGRQADPA
ncbi:MAG: Lrp/AsnC family transcriptional regulator [Desulfobacterales bacterium]|nr:Lrp/AsnC family transcriptional regulator [Desulfobacterales bacterium]